MKKLFTFLLGFACLALGSLVQAQSYAPEYIVNETFDGLAALPAGWSAGGGTYGSNAGTAVASDVMTISGSGGGTRGHAVTFPSSGTEADVYVEFDWKITSAALGARNAFAMYLQDASSNDILFLYTGGTATAGFINCWNLNPETPVFTGSSFTLCEYNDGGSADITANAAANVANKTALTYAAGKTYHVKAQLDFTNKKIVELTITETAAPTNTVTLTNLDFLSASAANVSKIGATNNRSSACSNGSNANFSTSFDNFQTYKLVEVAGFADVTVKYQDLLGNTVKADRVAADQPIDIDYSLLDSDKESFTSTLTGEYCVYDAIATGADFVTVAAGGSEIIVKFQTAPVTAGTYVWTGATDGVWDELTANFSVSGGSNMAYQQGNGVLFDVIGTANQAVTMASDMNVGANDVTISAGGYTLSGGIYKLKGTGTLIANASATMELANELTGGVQVNSGLFHAKGAAVKYTLADGALLKLETGAEFTTPIAATGTITIEPVSDVNYATAITGASVINLQLNTPGSLKSATWSNAWRSTVPDNATINVTTTAASSGFAVADANLQNVKVNLGDNIRVIRFYNQASSGGGTNTIQIGELSGTASTTLEGGFVDSDIRHLEYSVGALNTDATFAGVIKNYGSVTQANLNIYKKGTGTWTLTGASTYYPGVFNVDAGTVVMDGSLTAPEVPVTVAAAATLKGSGSIAGATTVNGTLDATAGSLSFGGNLTLAGTTNFQAVSDGLRAAGDAIAVGGDLAQGGTLNITLDAEPDDDAVIQVFDVTGAISGSFTQVNLPTAADGAYSYDPVTGAVTYEKSPVGVNGADAAKDVLSVKYYDLTGKEVSEDAQGAVIKKTTYVDGSVSNEKVLKK